MVVKVAVNLIAFFDRTDALLNVISLQASLFREDEVELITFRL